MKLSIIIPAYNEEQTIVSLIDAVFAVPLVEYEKEVIVVDDGSSDQTPALLQQLQNTYPIRIHTHAHNAGKGAAIRSGFQLGTGDIFLIQDADLEYSPHDYEQLLAPFAHEDTHVAYGARTHKPAEKGYWHYIVGAWLLDVAARLLFAQPVHDIYTGYKVFRKSVITTLLPLLHSNGFDIEAEMTARLLMSHYAITFVPISYRPRSFSAGKKIRARDAFKGFLTLLRIRAGY